MAGYSLDEYLGEAGGRSASPLDLSGGQGRWKEKLAALTKKVVVRPDLALPAFSLIRGGDLFEAKTKPKRTDPALIAAFVEARLTIEDKKIAREEKDLALSGVLSVVSGNPAICQRMLLAKPIRLVIVPKGRDFRNHGFPPNSNPRAAGLFFNHPDHPFALVGLREELIVEKPYLMVHEMTHAVHLLALTTKERAELDRFLLPVYRSRTWAEEAVAIYAERAFGAKYTKEELEAPDLYGETRRSWREREVFALFIAQLLRPGP